jgi:hypothetical protein
MVLTRRSLDEAGEKGVKVHVSDELHKDHEDTYNAVWKAYSNLGWRHGSGNDLKTFKYFPPTGNREGVMGQDMLLRHFIQDCPSLVSLSEAVFDQLVDRRKFLLGTPHPVDLRILFNHDNEPNPALEHQPGIHRAFSELWPQLNSKFNWTRGGESDDDDVYYKPGVEQATAQECDQFSGKLALLCGFAFLEPSILDLPYRCVTALADERSATKRLEKKQRKQQQQPLLQQHQLQGQQQLQSQTPPITTDNVRRLTETPQPITTDTEPEGHEHESWLSTVSPRVSSSSSSSASSGGTSVAGTSASSGGTSVAGTGRADDDESAGQDARGSPGSVRTSPASPPRNWTASKATASKKAQPGLTREAAFQAAQLVLQDTPLPLAAGGLTVHELGVVNPDPAYHVKTHVFPVGFRSERLYASVTDPTERVPHFSEVLRGDTGPVFRVSHEGGEPSWEGPTSSNAWANVLADVNKKRLHLGLGKGGDSISGPEMFGLANPKVAAVIEGLDGVLECEHYVFRAKRAPGTEGGRKGAGKKKKGGDEDDDEAEAEARLPAAPSDRSMRGSTKASSSATQALARQLLQVRAAASASALKRPREPQVRLTQQQLLEEAARTEVENKRSLELRLTAPTPAASPVTEAPVTSAVEAARNAAAAAWNAAAAAKREAELEVDATARELEDAHKAEHLAAAQLALATQKRLRLEEKTEETAKKLKRCSVAEQIAEDQGVIAERQANIEALKRQHAELGL